MNIFYYHFHILIKSIGEDYLIKSDFIKTYQEIPHILHQLIHILEQIQILTYLTFFQDNL